MFYLEKFDENENWVIMSQAMNPRKFEQMLANTKAKNIRIKDGGSHLPHGEVVQEFTNLASRFSKEASLFEDFLKFITPGNHYPAHLDSDLCEMFEDLNSLMTKFNELRQQAYIYQSKIKDANRVLVQ